MRKHVISKLHEVYKQCQKDGQTRFMWLYKSDRYIIKDHAPYDQDYFATNGSFLIQSYNGQLYERPDMVDVFSRIS